MDEKRAQLLSKIEGAKTSKYYDFLVLPYVDPQTREKKSFLYMPANSIQNAGTSIYDVPAASSSDPMESLALTFPKSVFSEFVNLFL